MLKIAFDSLYIQQLPEGHRFPMLKYELIRGQLLHEGTIRGENIFSPRVCTNEVVLMTHCRDYLDKLNNQKLSSQEQRRIGFPQSPELTLRELIITQGTIDCALYALKHGISLNIAGGTHHAFHDHGQGFCMLNDIAVASNYLISNNLVHKILIIDLDVHQGNGTANIFRNEPRVFTFSMHGAHNFPFHKEISDLDLPLEDGMEDGAYLELVSENLDHLLATINPDFVFYLSGVDILATDRYGKLNISMQGCKERDKIVFSSLRKKSIPCAVAMGGGYSQDIKIIVEAHCNTFRLAKDIYDL